MLERKIAFSPFFGPSQVQLVQEWRYSASTTYPVVSAPASVLVTLGWRKHSASAQGTSLDCTLSPLSYQRYRVSCSSFAIIIFFPPSANWYKYPLRPFLEVPESPHLQMEKTATKWLTWLSMSPSHKKVGPLELQGSIWWTLRDMWAQDLCLTSPAPGHPHGRCAQNFIFEVLKYCKYSALLSKILPLSLCCRDGMVHVCFFFFFKQNDGSNLWLSLYVIWNEAIIS